MSSQKYNTHRLNKIQVSLKYNTVSTK